MAQNQMTVTASDSKTYNGYLAVPPSGEGPALIVVQEIFGVNSHIREVADLYAAEGFVAFAPDVFFRVRQGVELGYSDSDLQNGIALMQKLDMKQVVSDLSSAAQALKERSDVNAKVGAVGYCMGGLISYLLAANKAVDAAVAYYGGGIDGNLDKATHIACPLLMHFAGSDKFIPQSSVNKIKEAFKGRSDVRIYSYSQVDHGFNCDQRGSYNRQSAMLAYARSAAFFHRYLDGD